jgi:uncharacterized membrane protein YozB (DUF420 family)
MWPGEGNVGSGILGTGATLVANINLILQIVILVVLTIGAFQARRGRLDAHHTLMTAAVIINAVLIIAIMNPSFFRILPFALDYPGAPGPKVMWPHVALGAVAELLGAYLVIRLKLDPSRASDLGNLRRVMVVTLLLWTTALVVGIAVYIVLHV